MLAFVLAVCLTLPPIEGPVVAGFEPSSGYAGHWGIDIAAPSGSEISAPEGGVVTFAGRVAGMNSVTILITADVRISVSYLSSIEITAGTRVEAGTVVGRSGLAHGVPAVHVSVRVGDAYVDPIEYLRCRSGTIRLLADR